MVLPEYSSGEATGLKRQPMRNCIASQINGALLASSGHDPHPAQSQNTAFAQTGL